MSIPDPHLAEIVLDRILTIVSTQADELQVHGVIRGLALEEMEALSPELRNEILNAHIDALDWWLSGSWHDTLNEPAFEYGTPPTSPPLSVVDAKLVTVGSERHEPGEAPQTPKLSSRDSVDSVTGYDEPVG